MRAPYTQLLSSRQPYQNTLEQPQRVRCALPVIHRRFGDHILEAKTLDALLDSLGESALAS
jgi:hypothetical protein